MFKKISKKYVEEKYRHTKIKVFKNKLLGIIARFMIHPKIRLSFYRKMGMKIGENVFIGLDCYLDDQIPELLTIEDDVIIAFRVIITTHDDSDFTAAPVLIKKGAYIGTGAIILQGVTIGENSIVGAGSVVTRDIAPNSIAVGVPAKTIKKRGLKR